MSVVSLQGHQYNDVFSLLKEKKKKKVSVIQAPRAMTPSRTSGYMGTGGIMLQCLWSNRSNKVVQWSQAHATAANTKKGAVS